MTDFDDIIGGMTADGAHWRVNPGEDWRQGRTLFGGLSAALCVAACEKLVPDLPLLRAGQIAFIGPAAGEAVLVPTLLRQGKSVTFMGCDLIAEDRLAARAIFTFGASRESSLSASAPHAPIVPRPEDCVPLFGKTAPAFTVHMDQRNVTGVRPVSGADKGELLIWVRHANEVSGSKAALLALGDALPPASMPRFTAPAMISTMTWGFDLFAPEQHDGRGWHLMRSTDDGVGHGYAGQAMSMWDAHGAPVLIARQSIAMFG